MKRSLLLLPLLAAGWVMACAASCPPPPQMLKVLRAAHTVRLVRLGSRMERNPDPLYREASFVGFRALETWVISAADAKKLAKAFGRTEDYDCAMEIRQVAQPRMNGSQLGLRFDSEAGTVRLVLLEPEDVILLHSSSGSYTEVALSQEGEKQWSEALAVMLSTSGEPTAQFYRRMGSPADSAAATDNMAVATRAAELDQMDLSHAVDLEQLGLPPLEGLSKLGPIYPQAAREAGVDGVVILAVLVDSRGWVRDIQVRKSIPMLDQAAIDAVRQWRFEPFVWNGKPAATWTRVPVKFSLHGP
jgi:TonB family protein